MLIERIPANRKSLTDFADEHGLVMVIGERAKTFYCGGDFEGSRYYAHFKHAEISDGKILTGAHGNGASPEEAMKHYAERISGELLVVDAFKPERREIYVPELYCESARASSPNETESHT